MRNNQTKIRGAETRKGAPMKSQHEKNPQKSPKDVTPEHNAIAPGSFAQPEQQPGQEQEIGRTLTSPARGEARKTSPPRAIPVFGVEREFAFYVILEFRGIDKFVHASPVIFTGLRKNFVSYGRKMLLAFRAWHFFLLISLNFCHHELCG
jgi:hypothetical protein